MDRVLFALMAFVHDDRGQDLLEYGFLAALIALVAMLAVGQMGDIMNTLWWGPIAQAF